MLFLIQATLEGEPVGVWDSEGHNLYSPGNDLLKNKAKARLGTLTSTKPWPAIVGDLTQGVNHQYWWSSTDSPSMQQALSDTRDRYFAQSAENHPLDKD